MNTIQTQFAVVGGGPAGVCGALAAARRGMKTVLIHNRPVLGGNSSSEIRVWTRGAVGAGNFYSEEMGIWGELKLMNLYRNPEGNPIFWDDVLLDAVLSEPNLELLLNTEISGLNMDGGRVSSVSGVQQGTERHFVVEAEVFLDATGDASLGYLAGLPYYMGDTYIPSSALELPQKLELLGCSILFFTKREDHPVAYRAPSYAYAMEEIAGLINYGGRIVNEKMGGSDCWWFEFGGSLDTIGQLQDITMELKRLVMGVWNYIKNSGLYDAEYYTLEWVGNIPGKRESRRVATQYILTEEDVRSNQRHDDGAFYGGWYMDFHPSDGLHDSGKENCIQIPVNVYQIPLGCLYNRQVPNLLFAGRNMGTERGAFVSSRIMNTCALAGQAAGELAGAMLQTGKAPAQMGREDIQEIQRALLRGDMFIPGAEIGDSMDKALSARAVASSYHQGQCGEITGQMEIGEGSFVCFPGASHNVAVLSIRSDRETELAGQWYFSPLPNRFCPGTPGGRLSLPVQIGENQIRFPIPEEGAGQFCTITFQPCEGVSVLCTKKTREGFLCGNRNSPEYREPALAYENAVDFYRPQRVLELPNRPWKEPNQWKAAVGDKSPWIEVQWQEPQDVSQIRLYLDPSLNEELPSSRAKHWQESHHFVAREGMPDALIRDAQIQCLQPDGTWRELGRIEENHQRLVTWNLAEPVCALAIRVSIQRTWGGGAAVYHIGVY